MTPPEAPGKNEQTDAVLRSVRVAIMLVAGDAPKLTLSEALAIEHAGKKLAALLVGASARMYPPRARMYPPRARYDDLMAIVEYTAAEVAGRKLDAHRATCSFCRPDGGCCSTAIPLRDAVRAFSVCAACYNVEGDHTPEEREACARRIDRRE